MYNDLLLYLNIQKLLILFIFLIYWLIYIKSAGPGSFSNIIYINLYIYIYKKHT